VDEDSGFPHLRTYISTRFLTKWKFIKMKISLNLDIFIPSFSQKYFSLDHLSVSSMLIVMKFPMLFHMSLICRYQNNLRFDVFTTVTISTTNFLCVTASRFVYAFIVSVKFELAIWFLSRQFHLLNQQTFSQHSS
jgi:hypothetical protein